MIKTEEINAILAKAKGWTRDGQNGWLLYKGIAIIDAKFTLPDYQGDANLYMQLFEEMPNPILRKWNDIWLCIPESRKSMIIESIEIEATTIGEAVCLAWLKMKGIEI